MLFLYWLSKVTISFPFPISPSHFPRKLLRVDRCLYGSILWWYNLNISCSANYLHSTDLVLCYPTSRSVISDYFIHSRRTFPRRSSSQTSTHTLTPLRLFFICQVISRYNSPFAHSTGRPSLKNSHLNYRKATTFQLSYATSSWSQPPLLTN